MSFESKNFIMLSFLFALIITVNSDKLKKSKDKEEILNKLIGSNFKVKEIIEKKNPVYTQGLIYVDNNQNPILYESGGLYRTSTLTKMKYPSLEVISKQNLAPEYFAEGIAIVDKIIYQLTWQERKILKYDSETLDKIGEISMPKELDYGWGLSAYKNGIIATDGSNNIRFYDNNFKFLRNLNVKNNNSALNYINDLTYDGNYIYANVYYSNNIYKIDDTTGEVVDIFDMKSLVDNELNEEYLTYKNFRGGDVLNGISHMNGKKFLVTGKKWKFFYEVEFN